MHPRSVGKGRRRHAIAITSTATRLQPNTLVQDGTGWDEHPPKRSKSPKKPDALGQDGTRRDERSQVEGLVRHCLVEVRVLSPTPRTSPIGRGSFEFRLGRNSRLAAVRSFVQNCSYVVPCRSVAVWASPKRAASSLGRLSLWWLVWGLILFAYGLSCPWSS